MGLKLRISASLCGSTYHQKPKGCSPNAKLVKCWNGGKDIINARKGCADSIALVRSGGYLAQSKILLRHMKKVMADVRRKNSSVEDTHERIWQDERALILWLLSRWHAYMDNSRVRFTKYSIWEHGCGNFVGLWRWYAFRDSSCNLSLVTQVRNWLHKWFRRRTREAWVIGNSPGSWKNCNGWPRCCVLCLLLTRLSLWSVGRVIVVPARGQCVICVHGAQTTLPVAWQFQEPLTTNFLSC